MNHLARVDSDRYYLSRHAHIIVYDGNERELLTVYDCGYAQKPPSAQLLGTLGRIGVDHELTRTPTGYLVSLAEPGVLHVERDEHISIDQLED